MNSIAFLRRAAVLGFATTALAACGDPTGNEHAEPDIASVTITSGTNTIQLGPSGQSGTLSLTAGGSHTVTIRTRNAAGADDPVVMEDAEDFEVRIRQGSTSRFTQTGTGYPFTGTITTGSTTGQAVYTVEVYSIDHDHIEWTGQLTLNVTSAGTT